MTAVLERGRASIVEPWRRLLAVRIVGPLVKIAVFAVITYVAAKLLFKQPPEGLFLYGAMLGTLYGLIGAGVILIYRSNRIINFAAGSMGAVPSVLFLLLMTVKGLSYWIAFPAALLGGALLGAIIDVVVIRRFSKAPRLILTVVTIGVSQLLAFIAAFIPRWLGVRGIPDRIVTPFSRFRTFIDNTPINGDYAVAVITVVALCGGLAAFFRFTKMGIAVRASAENADRASLLGIPVLRVGTVAWAIAGLFASTTIFLRSPLVGLPLGGLAGATVILYAMTAAVIARMESLPTAIAAGIAIGIIDQSSVYATGSSSLATAIMLIVILGALLFQKGRMSRAYDTGVETWQAVRMFRSIPSELRDLKEVRAARATTATAVLAFFLAAPFIVGEGNRGNTTLVLIYAMVGVSLVILTGWAGQISLGQVAFVGIGAMVGGGLAANYNVDFFVALIAGGLAGALAAVLIGVPALRIQGLFLAVSTLAFAAATQFYVLDERYIFRELLPQQGTRIERPVLWERISLGGPTEELPYYYLCLVFLGLSLAVAVAFRRNRSGRVLIAVRDNQRAAPSYSINLARTRLAAFAVSGYIAATAGVLLAYQQGAIDSGTYSTTNSITIFCATVVGGLTSLAGAVIGAVLVVGVSYLGEDVFKIQLLDLLVTGPGLVIVLLILPGGIAEAVFKVRDNFLRWVANRNEIMVPSLFADRRIEPDEAEQTIVESAEHHVEEVDTFDVLGDRTIVCPVCEEVLSVEEAPDHDHFQPGGEAAPDPDGELAGTGGGRSRLTRARGGRR